MWPFLILLFALMGCTMRGDGLTDHPGSVVLCEEHPEACESSESDGSGGGMPYLTLPFSGPEYWVITQGYNGGTHVDYGGLYSDERFALDFSRSGCKAWGMPVTPLSEGIVLAVEEDNGMGTGFGNSVLVTHGDGLVSRYAHFSEVYVMEGEAVTITDFLGAVGNSGAASGVACGEHPGTHLHVSLYKDGEALRAEPLSGNKPLQVGCWYNRFGDESCSGEPGEYDDENDIDDEGELAIASLDVDPEQGTAGETVYTWTSVVVSPDFEPATTLWIFNPIDGVKYDFPMETESTENPWVFTYSKTLQDPTVYHYWVKADNGDGNATSSVQWIGVDEPTTTPLDCDTTVSSGQSIQAAIDSAGAYDTLCVEPGTYIENLVLDGRHVVLKSTNGAAVTILDGGNTDHTVSFLDGATATLDGFTVRNGNHAWGGGVFIDNAHPTVVHCLITENNYYGIGIWNNSVPLIMNSVVSQNEKRGVFVTNWSEPELINLVIADNMSSGLGSYANSEVTLVNTVLVDNTGYGIYAEHNSTVVTSYNDVWGNSAGNFGGMAYADTTDFSLNVTFSDNTWYTLASGSVCKDAGDSASFMNDVDGSRNDVGAYGGPLGSW